MAQRRQDAAGQVKDHEARMAHDVFNVVAEDPEIQHVADQVHPSPMHEHAAQQRHVGGDADRDRVRKIGVPEQQGWNRSILKHERFCLTRRKAGLIEEDKHAENDEGDRDDGREFSRVVVLKRDHAASGLGVVPAAVNERSRQCGIGRQRSIRAKGNGEAGCMRVAAASE